METRIQRKINNSTKNETIDCLRSTPHSLAAEANVVGLSGIVVLGIFFSMGQYNRKMWPESRDIKATFPSTKHNM
jgi:hypothetical protein